MTVAETRTALERDRRVAYSGIAKARNHQDWRRLTTF